MNRPRHAPSFLWWLPLLSISLVPGCSVGSTDAGLPGDVTTEMLVEAFSPCDLEGDIEPPEAHVSSRTGGWFLVERVVDRPEGDWEGSAPVTMDVTEHGGDASTTIEARAYVNGVKGIEWALEAGADAWVVIAPPEAELISGLVGYVLLFPANAEPFLPGECMYEVVQKPLQEHLGDAYTPTMLALIGKSSAEVAELLGATETG
jgi:hypothetical protein